MWLAKSVANAFGFGKEDCDWKTTVKVVGAVVGVGIVSYGAYKTYHSWAKSKSPTTPPPFPPPFVMEAPPPFVMEASSPFVMEAYPPPFRMEAGTQMIETPRQDSEEEGKDLQVALRYKEEGNKMFIASRHEEAKRLYTDAILKCPITDLPNLAVFYQNRAATSDSLKQWELVITDCDEAIIRNSRYQKAYSRRGKAKLQLKQYEGAAEDTACGYYLQPEKKTKANLQIFMEAISEFAATKSIQLVKSRVAPLNFGIEVVRSYIANSPCDPVLSSLEVYAKVQEGERTAFHRACIKMLAGDSSVSIVGELNEELAQPNGPFYAQGLLLRATVFCFGGCPEKAELDLAALLAVKALSPRIRSSALLRRGLLHVNINHELGLKHINMAIEADPTNPDVYHQRAQISMMMQNLPKAREDFERAQELHVKATGAPNIYVTIHKLTCELHLVMGNDMGIVYTIKEMCDENPKIAELWLIYGQTLMLFGLFPQADEAYETSLNYCYDNPKIYLQRAALMLTWTGSRAKAIEYLKIAQRVDPYCDSVYESLGAVLLQEGKIEEALKIFEQHMKVARTLTECQKASCMYESTKVQMFVANKFQMKNLANVFLAPEPAHA